MFTHGLSQKPISRFFPSHRALVDSLSNLSSCLHPISPPAMHFLGWCCTPNFSRNAFFTTRSFFPLLILICFQQTDCRITETRSHRDTRESWTAFPYHRQPWQRHFQRRKRIISTHYVHYNCWTSALLNLFYFVAISLSTRVPMWTILLSSGTH